MSHHSIWSGARWLCGSTLWASMLVLGGIQPVVAQTPLAPILQGPTASEQGVVVEAALVVQELASGTSTRIPENLLREAEGVAIIPHYIRGAFVVGVAGGRGVLLTRDEQRNWRAPEFVRMGGGSVGWQAGVQAIDLVLVFKTAKALDRIRAGKLTLGADASAAAGPLGRYTSAATDTSLQAEVYTYSRSKGLFAGVSLSGASIQPDVAATQRYYQTGQGGPGAIPTSTQTLIKAIEAASVPAIPGDTWWQLPPGRSVHPIPRCWSCSHPFSRFR
ncbi:MAG: lipid-binding SYLF domain-containing protein [Pirellulaceae bacterium]